LTRTVPQAIIPQVPEMKDRRTRLHAPGTAGFCRVVCFNERKIAALRRRLAPAGEIAGLAAAHKAVAHAGRLAVLRLLADEECCVCDVANVLAIPVSTSSQHLKALKGAGLVASRQDGKLVFHAPTARGLAMLGGGDGAD
jgi:DNA-binding transcriptional ArsR family regulator